MFQYEVQLPDKGGDLLTSVQLIKSLGTITGYPTPW